ncbi:hypothetical protein GT347_17455 [Xylophilus rhododendri]|uniref:Uncharacterized protein n=1 Tax=Xylophilus rhododendri TaxID=2697032 RepID=A0A857J8Q3_9BURK|nr:hypothetical protein [Xylophilus rhododendri]QHI99603.1 hypothetical protein GT347_17455 [Xylophilus rhododendri]
MLQDLAPIPAFPSVPAYAPYGYTQQPAVGTTPTSVQAPAPTGVLAGIVPAAGSQGGAAAAASAAGAFQLPPAHQSHTHSKAELARFRGVFRTWRNDNGLTGGEFDAPGLPDELASRLPAIPQGTRSIKHALNKLCFPEVEGDIRSIATNPSARRVFLQVNRQMTELDHEGLLPRDAAGGVIFDATLLAAIWLQARADTVADATVNVRDEGWGSFVRNHMAKLVATRYYRAFLNTVQDRQHAFAQQLFTRPNSPYRGWVLKSENNFTPAAQRGSATAYGPADTSENRLSSRLAQLLLAFAEEAGPEIQFQPAVDDSGEVVLVGGANTAASNEALQRYLGFAFDAQGVARLPLNQVIEKLKQDCRARFETMQPLQDRMQAAVDRGTSHLDVLMNPANYRNFDQRNADLLRRMMRVASYLQRGHGRLEILRNTQGVHIEQVALAHAQRQGYALSSHPSGTKDMCQACILSMSVTPLRNDPAQRMATRLYAAAGDELKGNWLYTSNGAMQGLLNQYVNQDPSVPCGFTFRQLMGHGRIGAHTVQGFADFLGRAASNLDNRLVVTDPTLPPITPPVASPLADAVMQRFMFGRAPAQIAAGP